MINLNTKKKNFTLKIIVLITFIAMVAVNALANILPINGMNTGEVSDSFSNLFAPAGVTFAIWGVIYFLLLLYSLYQFGFFQRIEDNYREGLFKKIGIYFSFSSLLNIAWIFLWHYKKIEITVPIIIGILILLILINNNTMKMKLSIKDYIFIRLPFSIYMGWITVATIANITTLLVKRGYGNMNPSPVFWTIVVLIVGVAIASLTIIRNKDIAYGLPVIWAYIGIYLKHVSNTGWDAQYTSIIFTVVASILVLVAVEIYTLFHLRKGNKKIRDI